MTNPVPFKNDIGQTINPGDKVVIVTVCSHTVATRTGTYIGCSDSGTPQVRRNIKNFAAFYKGTDTRATGWPYKGEVEYKHFDVESVGTLQRGRIYALREDV